MNKTKKQIAAHKKNLAKEKFEKKFTKELALIKKINLEFKIAEDAERAIRHAEHMSFCDAKKARKGVA